MTIAQTDGSSQLTVALDDAMRRLAGKTERELVRAFAEARRAVAEQLVIAATIVRIFDENGWDTSQLSASSRGLQHLRRVAYGQLLPELVLNDRLDDGLVRCAARLPIPDQRRIASDESLEVVSLGNGGIAHRLIRPSDLTPEQVRQVFAADHVRSQAEQRSYLEEMAARRSSRPTGPGPVVIDEKAHCIYVTGDQVKLTAKQLAEYVARLAG